MNMKTKLTALVALLILGAAQIHAAQTNLVQTFNIQLSAWIQGAAVTNYNIVTWSAIPKRISTADIIRVLGTSTTNHFSSDAKLLIITPLPDGDSSIVVRDGTNNVDVSLYFRHNQKGPSIQKGRLNTNTGVGSGIEYSAHNFSLRNARNFPNLTSHFDVGGYSVAGFCALLNSHAQIIGEAYEYTAFVSGDGDINGEPAVVRGTISGKGRRVEIQQ